MKVDRSELVKTLELVKPALATHNMVPIFQCFAFSKGRVVAYDDTIGIVAPLPANTEVFGIHGGTLLGLLSASRSDEVVITLSGSEAVIKTGKTLSKLPYQTGDAFIFEPPAEVLPNKIAFTASVAAAIRLCLETVSVDATQAALNGITYDNGTYYSCDGDAVTCIRGSKGKGRTLIPTQFCQAALKLWDALEAEKAELTFDDKWACLKLAGWAIYGRLLDIKNPLNFEAEIKKTVGTPRDWNVVPVGFNEALSRARVLSDPESAKTHLSIEKGVMTLFTETHMGEIKDTIQCKGWADVTANVNASHLQRALAHCGKIIIRSNCVEFEGDDNVYMLVSNMG